MDDGHRKHTGLAEDYQREQQYWNARGGKDYVSLSRADQERLVKWIHWEGQGRVLDLGGGSGMVSRLLADIPGSQCVCLDISYNLLQYCPVPAVQANAFHLPFIESSFDLIVAAAFFHHMPGKETELLEECYRVLVPGGRIVGYDPSARCVQNRLFMSGGPFRLKFFSPDERPIVPAKLNDSAVSLGFKDFRWFLFSFRNDRLTLFEFVQRYVLNPISHGFMKKYLDRWFFWSGCK